jgi:hypothetical protein
MKQISFPSAKVSEIKHVYKVRPRRDRRGVNLISDTLLFGCLPTDFQRKPPRAQESRYIAN